MPGHCVDTVGKNAKKIEEYITNIGKDGNLQIHFVLFMDQHKVINFYVKYAVQKHLTVN